MRRKEIINVTNAYMSRLIYSTEQNRQVRTGRLKSKKIKTDMLRSIGKQSGESVESVHEKKR